MVFSKSPIPGSSQNKGPSPPPAASTLGSFHTHPQDNPMDQNTRPQLRHDPSSSLFTSYLNYGLGARVHNSTFAGSNATSPLRLIFAFMFNL
jgi:hypothetical protein